MRFYNREKELDLLHKVVESKGVSLVIVKGLRRIGKTSLLREALRGKNAVNLFIPKEKTPSLFLEECSLEMHLPRFSQVSGLLRYLFEQEELIFIDEFQNFLSLDPGAFSDIQKLFEEIKEKNKNLCLLVTGSSYSLMKKIFSDYAKALYGRKDLELTLEELPLPTTLEILQDLGVKSEEEKVILWTIFGGLPKFYELLEKLHLRRAEEFLEVLFLQGRTVLEEGNSILVSEFGGAYRTYYSVLEAIAGGKTKLSEIASIFENNSLAANRYLDLLRKEYNLVVKKTPLLDDPRKSRQGIYAIKNNYLSFWFALIKRYEAYYEQNRMDELRKILHQQLPSFVGRRFEIFCMEIVREGHPFPFTFTRLGSHWGKISGLSKGQNQYEIDILAVNDEGNQILFGECKWQEQIDPAAVVEGLQRKAAYIDWKSEKRKEYYAVFAKSFQNRKIAPELSGKVFLFDLKDLFKLVKN